MEAYTRYAVRESSESTCSVRTVVKPILNLFHGERNGKMWRRVIDEGLKEGLEFDCVISRSVAAVQHEVLDEP